MYRAKETFWAPGNRRIVKGDLIAPHDSVVEGREDLFEAVLIPQALDPAQAAAVRQETERQADAPAAVDSAPQQASDDADSGAGDADEGGSQPSAPAAKKTAAKKTTTAARKPAGGDAK